MKCPDCKVEVKYYREFCPHCSASLFNAKHDRTEPTRSYPFDRIWINAGII